MHRQVLQTFFGKAFVPRSSSGFYSLKLYESVITAVFEKASAVKKGNTALIISWKECWLIQIQIRKILKNRPLGFPLQPPKKQVHRPQSKNVSLSNLMA